MKHTYITLLLTGGVLLSSVANTSAQILTPGDLVVSAYGTPTSTGLIDGQAVPISLQVFTPSTTASNESPLSTTILSGIDGEYGSSSEGNIQLSGNGQYLTIAGYNATEAAAGIGTNTNGDNGNATYTVGTPYGGTGAGASSYNSTATPLAQSSPADVARVADVIDGNGNVVSTTSFSNIYNTNNARAAYSPTGSSIYISGQGDKSTTDQGVFYGTAGASYSGTNTPASIYNANDTRYVTGYNGNLYYSLDKKNKSASSPTGIFMYTGSPTAPGSTAVQITPGANSNGTVNYSPEGFWFANSTTLYVADVGAPKNGGLGDGGIQKWTFSSSLGTWTLQYTLTPSTFLSPTAVANGTYNTYANGATGGESGFEAITGQVVGNTVDLFAVSYTVGDDDVTNGLYAIADTLSSTTGSGETFTELAASPGNGLENFKGVAFAPAAIPEPSTTSMLIVALLGGAAFVWKRKQVRKA